MNSKNIKKHLKARIRNWMDSIEDEAVKKTISENVIVTGGALVSLLTGEPVNDYDIYFRNEEACVSVAAYYVNKWNKSHPDKPVTLKVDEETGRVSCFVSSKGIADENEEKKSDISYNFDTMPEEDDAVGVEREPDRKSVV